ncbi:hypothetical protein E4U42_007034 [Claviceps africana]|uniref:Major facilitator superfamily (MFS) profile domain-containing protein n=1 Tax=Claviceps africana TaxID=83212 RepID=A0A8K0NNN8_9HYPO|nr:hypothetical protein E4U42_007034 [Claviceps africana]
MISSQKESKLSQVALATSPSVEDLLELHELEYTPDGESIRWSVSNKRHPRNWSTCRKTYDIGLVIFLDFFTTAISTAGSSVAERARHELGLGKALSVFLFVSVYLLGQMVGGIMFPPYSEAFGRKKLYIVSTGLYGGFCALTGAVSSPASIVIGRFVCGLLSAIPTIVVAGSIEDMFNEKGRTWLIFIWTVLANLGLTVGPMIGILIIVNLTWQWVFYIAAIVMALTMLLLLGIRESRPSLLLDREVRSLQLQTGDRSLRALNPDHTPDLRTFVQVGLFRPLRLFFTEPIVFMVSTISAFATGLIYLFTEALPPIYESMGFSTTLSSLSLAALAIGLPLGIFTRIRDHRMLARRKQRGEAAEPEHKILGFCIAAPALAAGLWWFTWTIPPAVTGIHWIVPSLALVFVGYAVNEFDTVLTGYLADSYLSYSASGFAALSILRSLLSAVFPMAATTLFDGLGANGGCLVLAVLATLFCAVPPLFAVFGKRIRMRSEFARFSLTVYKENGVD